MKIKIPDNQVPRPRPMVPTVSLTDEAYDILMDLSTEYDVSMRKLASAIIVGAYGNIEIEKGGSAHG
jgi:hypothetical protein